MQQKCSWLLPQVHLTSPRAAGTCASVPGQPAGKAGEGTSAAGCTSLWSTGLPCAQLSGRSQAATETCRVGKCNLVRHQERVVAPSGGCWNNMQKTYVCRLAGRRVTLHTLYFRRMVPQWVTSTFRPVKIIEEWETILGLTYTDEYCKTLEHNNAVFVTPLTIT